MKLGIALGLFIVTLPSLVSASNLPPCNPSDAGFVCGVERAEDLVRVGETPWIIASDMTVEYGTPPRVLGLGPLQAIRIDTHQVHTLYPASDSGVDWDRKGFPDCPEPPESISSHGLNIRKLGEKTFRLFVVNHGGRESVEIIDVLVSGERLHATWRGCISAPREGPPQGIWPNSVVPLSDGRIALSGFRVAIWRPTGRWTRLNSLNLGDKDVSNGIEVSRNGRWLFVANTAANTIIRVPVNGGSERLVRQLKFYPDNLRWGDDGYIYVTGPYVPDGYSVNQGPFEAFAIARIDPDTFSVREIFRSGKDGIDGKFGNPTAALRVKDHFWMVSPHQDRIAILSIKP